MKMADKTIGIWITVMIAIMLSSVVRGQDGQGGQGGQGRPEGFFTVTPSPSPTPAPDESARRDPSARNPQTPRAPPVSRDCRSAGASIAADSFRGAEAGAADAQAADVVNADLNRAANVFWVRPGCRVRRVTVPITRFFMLGNLRIRCTGRVQVGLCFGFCRSWYTIGINNNAVSKTCETCEPTGLRTVTQNAVLTCGPCLFYNYQFTSIQSQQCRCQAC